MPAEATQGELKYTVPTGEMPVRYKGFPPGTRHDILAQFETRTMTIRNGRTAGTAFSLDRHGFTHLDRPTTADDLYDDAVVRDVYYPETAAMVRDVTGASRVLVFDHTLRSNAPGRKGTAGVRGPAHRVHNDYTETSGPQRVRDLLPREAERLLARRFAIVNVWRPIAGPLEDAPLAVCDASSAATDDFLASALIYPDRAGETYGVAYNARHRWFYFPEMRANEALLFKCYDSDRSCARFTPHSAFRDPRAPVPPRPRESIETRMLVFFDP
jgi:hypothetical protein